MNHCAIRTFLNVGGNSKNIAVPNHYAGWKHILLDIDPRNNPDIVLDARELQTMSGEIYDAIYCSHNLEHHFRHDVFKVLAGFLHVLKNDGFAEIIVPNIDAVMKYVVKNGIDIDDFLYQSKAGPICVRDVLYGYGVEIQRSGCEYFAHRTGFSPKSLTKVVLESGFHCAYTYSGTRFEVRVLAFKQLPTDFHKKLLKIPDPKNTASIKN
jgi:SAM-dependent methyltransferase